MTSKKGSFIDQQRVNELKIVLMIKNLNFKVLKKIENDLIKFAKKRK